MSLLPLFHWFDETAIGQGIRSSTYWFPAIEVVHLLGLTLLYGSVLVLDLRLLGLGMRRQSVAQMDSEITPYKLWGIVLMFGTGIPLFLSEALKCYDNVGFWFKMTALLLAILFEFTVHRSVLHSESPSPLVLKATALTSMLLWLSVGLGGRAIAFV